MSTPPSAVEKRSSKGPTKEQQDELITAITEMDTGKVNEWLKQGHDPNFIWHKNIGWTPLLLACQKNSPEIVHLLLNANVKALPDLCNAKGVSPLLYLTYCRNDDMEGIFKEAMKGEKFDYKRCGELYSSHPVLVNDVLIVRALCAAGANVNIQDPEHNTPVCLAGKFLRLDLVLELLNKGATTTVPKGVEWRMAYVLGFKLLGSALKKNPNLDVHGVMRIVSKYDGLVSAILFGKGNAEKELAELKLVVKEDILLQNYINALQRVVHEYLAGKTKYDPGKAKLAGVNVFIEKLATLDSIQEARDLKLPFSEVFTDKKLADAAEKILKATPTFKGVKNIRECMVSLTDLLSLNTGMVKKKEPESLKKFNAILKELNDAVPQEKDEDSQDKSFTPNSNN